ncbi:MAG: hypothetical protein IPJ81_13110 [Chitinophagaceae bacterium]|nr:hypothetical protein [Chitinophagaceae bacterium]
MKLTYIHIVLAALFIGCGIVIQKSDSPEKLLIGKWEEVACEYERIDKENTNDIYQNLNLHKGEVWQFDNAHKLIFFNKNYLKETLNWNIKGRGHILELHYKDKRLEGYQIQEITKDKLVIHFNIDLQVRGIVKLTFKRITEETNA